MFLKKKEKKEESILPEKKYASLDEKITDYKRIFDEKGFTYVRCPNTRGLLDDALDRAAKAEKPEDIRRYCKQLMGASIEEKMVENTWVLDPFKTVDAPYTDEMITYFKDLIYDANRQAIKEKNRNKK